MFTGLVEELGKIKSITKGTKSARLTIEGQVVLQDVKLGDSIAVNGTCLTVVEYTQRSFTADVMPETVRSTVLAELKPGDVVNLERTLRLGDRLGGHIVSGHVDGVGVIRSKERSDNAIVVTIEAPPQVMRYIIAKGSIAIDGTSLTIVDYGADWFSVSLIPHTASLTTVGLKESGSKVNLEADVLGKYVAKLLGLQNGDEKKQASYGLTMEFLQQHGFGG
ncbi:MAG: riboflavin synthase [Anaeromusa sp.]|uniref:riboflavin synthase n=1 Tax=Anaeromusa sp. TaxID=1872520 RepID=UPI002B21E6A9|nr:riboflavin synthase [Anaeromusa sp.]MEA4833524.1 riboflavin synthase [Anaeromusa sp.]